MKGWREAFFFLTFRFEFQLQRTISGNSRVTDNKRGG